MRRGWRTVSACLLVAACGRKPAPARPLADLVRGARFDVSCRRLVAAEWPASLPVPLDSASGRRFGIFFYPLPSEPRSPLHLIAPTAEAVVDAALGATVECRVATAAPRELAGPRWTPEAAALDADAFDAKVAELDALAESVASVYAARRAPTAADADLARRYLALFELMAEPPYRADYYRLNPDFWEWLRAAAGRSIPRAP